MSGCWMYKCNREVGGPAGYYGDWLTMVFNKTKPVRWGGHYSTLSPEVARYLDYEIRPGDHIVCYQTDIKSVVGVCDVTKIAPCKRQNIFHGAQGLELWLQPVLQFATPFRIHDHKDGTILEHSSAVNGPVMLRELELAEARLILRLAGVPNATIAKTLRSPAAPRPRRAKVVDRDRKVEQPLQTPGSHASPARAPSTNSGVYVDGSTPGTLGGIRLRRHK